MYSYMEAVENDVRDAITELRAAQTDYQGELPEGDWGCDPLAAEDAVRNAATGCDDGSYTLDRTQAADYLRDAMISGEWAEWAETVDYLDDAGLDVELLDVQLRLFFFEKVYPAVRNSMGLPQF